MTTKRCCRCKREFFEPQLRECHHPAVNRSLGKDICYWCCRLCKHHTKTPLCGAIGCDYHDTGN